MLTYNAELLLFCAALFAVLTAGLIFTFAMRAYLHNRNAYARTNRRLRQASYSRQHFQR